MAKAKPAEAAEAAEETEGMETEGGESGQEGGLVVDLRDTDENAGYELLPRAVYACVIDELEFGYSQSSGNPMWTWRVEVEDGDFAGRKLFTHTTFNEGGLPRTKKAIMRVAPELLEGPFDPEEVAASGVMVGKRLRVRVDIKPYQGEKRNNVREILAPAGGGDDFV